MSNHEADLYKKRNTVERRINNLATAHSLISAAWPHLRYGESAFTDAACSLGSKRGPDSGGRSPGLGRTGRPAAPQDGHCGRDEWSGWSRYWEPRSSWPPYETCSTRSGTPPATEA
ncbi:hypothetical protein GCM10020216_079460 [Nonomuraea helvata]